MEHEAALRNISPLDGRYAAKTQELGDYCSEYALIKHRYHVEVEWIIFLAQELGLHDLISLNQQQVDHLRASSDAFSLQDAQDIKAIEAQTRHDVKAVEYHLKAQMQRIGAGECVEAVHFCCTSEDINNTAYSLMLKGAREAVLYPLQARVLDCLRHKSEESIAVAMIARTHGQPATPTTMGKELLVFCERLASIHAALEQIPIVAKMNGAVGNYNAHYCAYPDIDWARATERFLRGLGLEQNRFTTQIEPKDRLAELLQAYVRWNTVLLDLCRDMWGYIALDSFSQLSVDGHTGSSTMPHKVNPIDFENAEGNLGLANAIFGHLCITLPTSRWQRDLSDSTVMRNLGVGFGYTSVAMQSVLAGLSKVVVNTATLQQELSQAWPLLGEAIQSVMRKHRIPEPYEQMKALTRGKAVSQAELQAFIEGLPLPTAVRADLLSLTPQTYLGIAATPSKY